MAVIAEHSQLLAAIARGVMPAPYRGAEHRAGSRPSHPAPTDPAVVSGSGWQVPAARVGKDAAGAQYLADLVSCWLPGDAHRRLLELAQDTPRDGIDAGFESPVYAWCYALGQAFTAVAVALRHTGPRPNYPGAELELWPPDDAAVPDPENALPLSDDVALWLQ